MLATPNAAINVKYMDAQMQCGSADCGIFAIAFATTLANGEKPGGYYYDQSRVRKHLMHFLETQYLLAFPVIRKSRRGDVVKWSTTFQVYCSCRMQFIGELTVKQL